MDIHTHVKVKLLLSPRHSRGITHFIYLMITVHFTSGDAALKSIQIKSGKSLMQAAVSSGINGIPADCGGLLTCATCHVFVAKAFVGQLSAPDAEELAMLAYTATPSQSNSRLSCQIMLTDAMDGLTVELPISQY